jgi:tungstate transport system substrate-binding protein
VTRFPLLTGRLLALASAIMLAVVTSLPASAQAPGPLVLGTTLDLQKTGLLDVLIPAFERHLGRQVTVIPVSAPHALVLGIRSELDVLLVDAGDDEPGFMAAGYGVERHLVMHADEVIVGPRNDPAQVRGSASVEEALRRIIDTGNDWVSRADNSALFQVEKRLWREASIEPRGQPWYVPYGQGMIPTLNATTERQAYTLADRPTFLERRSTLDLAIQLEGAPDLLRLYHVIVANPARGAWIDEAGARAFAQWVLGPEAQELIRTFGVDRYGEPIFTPDAGRTEQELRPAGG